jgi:hypothetical protein
VLVQATRRRRGRAFAAGMGIAVMLSACGSSGHPNASPNAASSTTTTSFNTQTTADPNQQFNAIPFNVGDVVGLPNGWSVQVAKVTRPYVASGIAATPVGQQYVAVDMKMVNSGTEPVDVNANKIFTIVDSANEQHAAIAVPGHPSGLHSRFSPGATRTGRLIFAVPVGRQLRMLLDGTAIGTQRAVFQIDPPKTPPRD